MVRFAAWKNNLCTTTVMESGQHRISIKLMNGSGTYSAHFFGVVRDGRAWDADEPKSESTDAWYMHSGGGLYEIAFAGTRRRYGPLRGNGKEDQIGADTGDGAGQINDGQIISMVADLDKGTLRLYIIHVY